LPETEKWLKMHPDDTSLPDIAKYRLPYPDFIAKPKPTIGNAEVLNYITNFANNNDIALYYIRSYNLYYCYVNMLIYILQTQK
jgi:hypothetical protein